MSDKKESFYLEKIEVEKKVSFQQFLHFTFIHVYLQFQSNYKIWHTFQEHF